MKKFLKILGVIVLLLVVWYGARWAYYVNEYKQHLPETTIAVDDVDRAFHVFAPTQADGPHALVVLLNGGSVGPWRFPQQFRWEELAEEQGIVIAIPIGMTFPPNEGAWQLNTDADSMQDIDFVTAMIDNISANNEIDPARIYAVGYSLGSMFSYELACQMSTQFAAIASFAGTMPVTPKACEPERNVPIMHLHGVNDPIIAYGNTWDWKAWDSVGTMQDIPSLVEFWRSRFNCQNETERETDIGTHFVHDMCDQGARVEHHRIDETGHDWPESIDGVSTHDVLWTFLSEFRIGN